MTRTLVIGVGNPDCGDDAIGPLVTSLLRARLPRDVTILDRPGDMLALIDDWADHDTVVLIDAAAPIDSPGAVHRIDLRQQALPASLRLASTHAFGIVDAVRLAEALGRLPARLIAYAVEGAAFEPGASLSPAVAAAADVVVSRIAAELAQDVCHA